MPSSDKLVLCEAGAVLKTRCEIPSPCLSLAFLLLCSADLQMETPGLIVFDAELSKLSVCLAWLCLNLEKLTELILHN